MSEFFPMTNIIRHYWSVQGVKHASKRAERAAEFDRWLASVKAEAWDEGFDGGVDHCVLKQNVFNPYREGL